jgi:hypothetical protein
MTMTMLIKRDHLEPWHISDDGVTALCGTQIKVAVERARSKDHAYGNYFCKECDKIDREEDDEVINTVQD